MTKFKLKLFITGDTANSQRAIGNIKKICEENYPDQYELRIIDVLEKPQLAEEANVLATPTLIREFPPPLRRLIGDLSDKEKVLSGLDLMPGKIPYKGNGGRHEQQK